MYDIINCCIKYEGVFRYIYQQINIKLAKKVYKKSICQRTVNIINSANEGASLITKQGAVKNSLMRYVSRWSNKLLNKLFLKTPRLATPQKLKSNLFHSIAVDGKKQCLKKLCLV